MRKRKAKKKAKAKAKEEGKDHISGLPDELLHHIVSLLPTTKEAIRTCVLSKRWKLVWTHVSKIIFERREFRTRLFEHFLSCLDKTLTLHTAPKVEKIFLQHEYSYLTEDVPCPPLDSWLLSVVGREVKDLTLELDGELNEEDGCSGGYPLPQFLYQNSSLVKLSTTFCCFTPKGSVSWESLKHLSISLAALTDRVLENILQGTPLLHSLELSRCYGICRIDLSHNTRLKMLVMYDLAVAPYKLNSLIKISCPYLEDLEILGTWWGMNLEFINISPFASVSLDFEVEIATSDYDCQRSVMKLLQNVSHTKKLTLGNWCVQVLSSWRQSVLPFLSSTRKYLVLDISRFDLKWMCGIQHLLLSSHKLEKLVINFGHDHCKYWSDASTPICSWSPYGEFFTCLEFHLKTVEITGFNKSVCSHEYGYDFFRFLFAKSRVLERVIIFDLIEERDLMFQVAKELLSFPRASRSAVVLLQD